MAKIPTKITARIEYWESLGLPKMRSTKSKIYRDTIEKLTYLLDGTHMFVNEEHTMPDFRLAVDRYALQVFDEHYRMPYKGRYKPLPLSLFLYNAWADGAYLSTFKRCLNHHPTPINLRQPKIYQILTDSYIKISGNGYKMISDLTSSDLFNLARASNKLGAFYKRKNIGVSGGITNSQKTIIDAFLQCARTLTRYDPIKFSTYLLTRGWVWEKFPDYLAKNGYLAPKKPFNQYDY